MCLVGKQVLRTHLLSHCFQANKRFIHSHQSLQQRRLLLRERKERVYVAARARILLHRGGQPADGGERKRRPSQISSVPIFDRTDH